MKYIALIYIALTLAGCKNNDHLLVGSWVFDGDRTLAKLKKSPNTPESVLSCYTNKDCGYNTKLTYTSTTWRTVTDLDYTSYSHGPVE